MNIVVIAIIWLTFGFILCLLFELMKWTKIIRTDIYKAAYTSFLGPIWIFIIIIYMVIKTSKYIK